MVREHHKGPAVPTRNDCDIDFIKSKLKAAAETARPEGLGMTELEFSVKKRGGGRISPKSGVCFPPKLSIVVYCPVFDLYCDTPLLHFVCPCIVRVFHVFRRF